MSLESQKILNLLNSRFHGEGWLKNLKFPENRKKKF